MMLTEMYRKKSVLISGVTKSVLGCPLVAQALIEGGVDCLADSRIENIKKMRAAGISSRFLLLRTALSLAKDTIEYCDVSLNSEIKTLKRLSYFAKLKQVQHDVIVMVELGDLREGVMPDDLIAFVGKLLLLPNLRLIGIGTNLSCLGGVTPDTLNMKRLSDLVRLLENEFSIDIPIVSGGNSANYNWFSLAKDIDRINQLRLGESILLGKNPVDRSTIEGLHTCAFQLFGEIIESKLKPSMPFGNLCENAYGETKKYSDQGSQKRLIVALGRQDVDTSGLSCGVGLNIIGSSSDHIVIEDVNSHYSVGDEVTFNLSYSALVSAMSSPYISKHYINKR